MKSILILSSISALVFLGKIGLIAYETMRMDFNFDKPWPEETLPSGRGAIVEKTLAPRAQPARRTWGWVATQLQLRKAA